MCACMRILYVAYVCMCACKYSCEYVLRRVRCAMYVMNRPTNGRRDRQTKRQTKTAAVYVMYEYVRCVRKRLEGLYFSATPDDVRGALVKLLG